MHDIRAIGAKARKLRLEKDMNIKDIAREIGWSYWDYRSFENGWLIMSFRELEKLAQIFNTTEEELIEPLPDDEYKKLILHIDVNKDINDVELLDAIFDRVEDMFMVELTRTQMKSTELSYKKASKALNILDNEGELPF
jgi:transcriptional regulator with XRE-family HTH domain